MENSYKSSKNQLQCYKIKLIQYAIKLTSYQLPLPLVLICIIIQNLQLIAMALVSPLHFTSLGLDYFVYFANLIYPEHYLRTTSIVLYLVPLYLVFTILHFIIFIWAYWYQSSFRKIVHYIFFLTNTILISPNLLVNVSVLACTDSNPFSKQFVCFQQIHILYVILAIINLLWVVFCTFFVFFFYVNRDPFVSDYYGSSSNLWMLGKFLLKLAPVIYINVDPYLNFNVLYIVSFAGLNLVNFGIFKIMWPFFRNCQKIQKIVIHSQTVVIFVTAFFILLQFLGLNDENNVVFIMSWIIGNIFGQLVINVLAFKKQMILEVYLQDGSQQDQDTQQQVYIQFFYDILYKAQFAQQYQILHLLKLHEEGCSNQSCTCKQIINIYQNSQNKKIDNRIFYRFINQLIRQAKDKIKKNNGLKITEAYVSYYKLNQKIKSVQALSEILRNSKITLTEEISIRKIFVNLINQDNSATDLRKFNQFSSHLWNFQRYTQKAVQNCKSYWTQLIQQDCQISKIWRMANIVNKDKETIKDMVDNKLLHIFPKNLYTIKLYCQLLYTVYGQQYPKIQKYAQIYRLALVEEKQKIQIEDQLLFRQNQQMAVMCAVEYEGIFQFIRVSSNILNILQIRSIDLIQKSINTIIPQVYHQFHNSKIKQYLNKDDESIKQRNSNIFALSSTGRLVNCTYKAKIIPSFVYGLELICFLRKNKNKQNKKYLMYFYSKNSQLFIDNEYFKTRKSGDIIYIDPDLKKFLLTQDEKQLNENYNSKIGQILPEWDLIQEQIRCDQSESEYIESFAKIQLVYQHQLFPGIYIKYLCFTFRLQQVRISIDQSTISPYPTSRRQNLGIILPQCFLQASESRLSLMENQKKIIDPQLNGINISSKPINIQKSLITLISKIIIGLLIVFNILNYQLRQKQIKIQQQDFQTLQLTHQIKSDLFRVIRIEQNVLSHDNSEQLLQNIKNNTQRIYQLTGIPNINDNISVSLKFFQSIQEKKTMSYSLNDAIGYILTLIPYLQIKNYEQFTNLVQNIESIHKNFNKIPYISLKIIENRLKQAFIQDFLFQFFQFFIILILDITLAVRIYKIYQFAKLTFLIYENKIEINQIKQFSKRCQYFIQKLKGISQNIKKQKTQKIEIVFKQFRSILSKDNKKNERNRFEVAPIVNQQLNQNQRQQEEKLIQMKKKVTFQKEPSKIKYFLYAIVFILIWVSIKVSFRLINDSKDSGQKRLINRTIINQNLDINSEIYRLLFYLTVQNSFNSHFSSVLSSIKEKIMKVSQIDSNMRQQIKLHELFQIIIQLSRDPNGIPFRKVEGYMEDGHQQIYQHTKNKITNQYTTTYNKKPPYMLACYIILNIVSIFSFYRLFIVQEQIRIGCTLMMQMIGQNMLQNEEKNQKYKQLIPKMAI